ncbi:deleted in malignant brain tumors 1 protein-like [Physella acuta]|uniref:deleted in malignant brain tumors 1 protein-like n=1 Tax=Physella acuta TaxID=109671 RepID=UPI0027DBEED9|nr:deleted in malignant brain tumors 1 protein-like [Physella acuta]
MNEPQGNISSTGYPFGNLDNMMYTWTIQGHADSYIVLSLSFVETESCDTDYITVYDGATKNAPSFNKMCGTGVSGLIVSTTNNLFVTFETDGSDRYRGFYGEFYSHDNHIILNESQGNISSPGYPFGKLDNMMYTWTIQGKVDSYIVLNISDLGANCQYGYLRIYDGPTTFSPMFGNFCSSVPPGLMASTGNSMFVVLKTNSSYKCKGFYGNYEIRERHSTLCEVGNLASPGYPLRYLNNQEFTWNLSARADTRLILNLSFVETQSCDTDYITVYDGATKNARSSMKVCGRGVSELIVSTTNKLLVTFKTDSSETYRGFYGEFYSHDNHIILNESQGNISSPGYPFSKLDNMMYTWTIQGKADSYIVLK